MMDFWLWLAEVHAHCTAMHNAAGQGLHAQAALLHLAGGTLTVHPAVAQDPADTASSSVFIVSSLDVTHLKETELQLRGMELVLQRSAPHAMLVLASDASCSSIAPLYMRHESDGVLWGNAGAMPTFSSKWRRSRAEQ